MAAIQQVLSHLRTYISLRTMFTLKRTSNELDARLSNLIFPKFFPSAGISQYFQEIHAQPE